MKGYYSVIIFVMLFSSSVWASYDSYRDTERRISGDLTRALAATIEEKRDADWLSVDTVSSFRSHLQMVQLRSQASLSLHIADSYAHPKRLLGAIMGDTLHVSECLYANGYVACSLMSVWRMSDQRLSSFLAALSLMWLLLIFRYHRVVSVLFPLVNGKEPLVEGYVTPSPQNECQLVFSEEENRFYNAQHSPIYFTPMQQQLMLMFLNAPHHELTKQEICDALWPKKDDPSETLYTLIKRIKPILEANHVMIESERGRSYRVSIL